MKKKVMLIYPPGRIFQRGEDRCQANISESVATSVRACNDLGNLASNLKESHYLFLRDYQTENADFEIFFDDFRKFKPDYLFLSTTNGTVFEDLAFLQLLKERISREFVNYRYYTILKGAIFYNPPLKVLTKLDLSLVDFLIGTEAEFVLPELIKRLECEKGVVPLDFTGLFNFLYKDKSNEWQTNGFDSTSNKLTDFLFPDRSFLNNELYINPESGKTMATIETSRGCSASCIYCLTPALSGKKIRFREAENVLREIKECYEKYGITEFFFKSDTFTMNAGKVSELCQLLIENNLADKISWVANSRTKPLSEDLLKLMKKAGCKLIAFGFESGSDETLAKIKKGTTTKDNLEAARFAQQAGLKVFGFFMLGLPWETKKHLEETKKHIFTLAPDYLEVHLATPFYGTELYRIYQKEGLVNGEILGNDYFNSPPVRTKFLTTEELVAYRKKIIFTYHFRVSFIIKKLKNVLINPGLLIRYFKYGFKLFLNSLK